MTAVRDLARLPKAHLHLHFEEGIRQSTLDEFATELGRPTPRMTGFETFIEFDHLAQAAVDVMRTPEHLRRMVLELAEDAAAHGCVWIEPAVWLPLHRRYIGPDELTLEILVDASREAAAQTGVGIGWLLATNRNDSPADAVEQARIAARWVDRGVVAFGLHNDESRFPPEPFAPAFDVAREAGLLLTPHAGELAGPESVRASIEVLGAHRVQHGIRAVEDPRLLELIVEREVCLDVCPTSNIVLKSVESYDVHPFGALLDAGVPCSLNADDPVMFGCDVLSEYELAREVLGFGDERMATIARTSLRASGAPADVVRKGLDDVDRWSA
ncbi:adenosine deaminase [Herbiconiux moechotypicola]|uniref:Adenosine deaminase n=1 Tax=Herbiconiux moechotypicola TaxID=637393 RepID=A0ABN3DG34_9MICO|nr:adenosine deaminase [Herbiconiux moechotypicola]MCS5729333.1 adenosine deaminase [Herbiconiux moechotypicola]